eukprot:gene7698-5723_t
MAFAAGAGGLAECAAPSPLSGTLPQHDGGASTLRECSGGGYKVTSAFQATHLAARSNLPGTPRQQLRREAEAPH